MLVLDHILAHLMAPDNALAHLFILDLVPEDLLVPEWDHGLACLLVQNYYLVPEHLHLLALDGFWLLDGSRSGSRSTYGSRTEIT